MTNLKSIIVDDERLARVNLRRLLEPHQEIEVVGEANSCQSAVDMINMFNPGLIFLDIQLSGETGFDLLEMIDKSIKIIFVTAYDEYAIRAFDVNAIDYLLKPVNPERLKSAVDKVVTKEKVKKSAAKSYEYSDSIYVRLNNFASRFIKISSITSIEPVGNYSRIDTIEGRHCLVLKTLKQWQEELPVNNFVRIHRSRIVNLEHVDHIEKNSENGHRAYLKNKAEPLEVSRRYARRLKSLN
ncbi:MAG TPA: LytTR family DNA-binding domain-containing protein [Bacteroidales bacterium]|nr:LytTR family DNA-binding domain-containing protein [Bacteroidales bacterium]